MKAVTERRAGFDGGVVVPLMCIGCAPSRFMPWRIEAQLFGNLGRGVTPKILGAFGVVF